MNKHCGICEDIYFDPSTENYILDIQTYEFDALDGRMKTIDFAVKYCPECGKNLWMNGEE